jgi:iron-sulfur cluster repair protein YtfE (RIC family)
MRDLSDCLPYVRHMRMAHRRQNEALRAINGLLTELELPESAKAAARLVESLQALRADLAFHFAEEESGGCVEEAVIRCPGLSPDARRAGAQHRLLLNHLNGVLQRMQELSPQSGCVAPIREVFQQFAVALKEHENAEERILQAGFGVGTDVAD